MQFRQKLKQLYDEKLSGHGDKAKFDFSGMFGISERNFRLMFDGGESPIRHDVAERVLEAWVREDERDAIRAMPGYPPTPHYVQDDVNDCMKGHAKPLGDLVRAICDYFEIPQSELRTACRARGVDVVVVSLLDRNQMITPEQGVVLLSAIADLSHQAKAVSIRGLCELGVDCQHVLQQRKLHFGDALGAFRQLLTGSAEHPCEWKHICGEMDTGYNTLIDFERSKKVPETNLVDQVIGVLANNSMRALNMPYGNMPPMQRELAFYDDAEQRYEAERWLRRPERWTPAPATQQFAARLRAIRLELDNGKLEDDNPGSQKSIGKAVKYPDDTARTSIGNIERCRSDMPHDRKLRLYRHLGCKDEHDFAALGDAAIATRHFREENFGKAIHAAVGRLKNDDETRKDFCARHGLETEYTRTFAHDSHERGSWLIRKIVGALEPCGVASEADIYAVAGMDCPAHAIGQCEAFVNEFHNRPNVGVPTGNGGIAVSSQRR